VTSRFGRDFLRAQTRLRLGSSGRQVLLLLKRGTRAAHGIGSSLGFSSEANNRSINGAYLPEPVVYPLSKAHIITDLLRQAPHSSLSRNKPSLISKMHHPKQAPTFYLNTHTADPEAGLTFFIALGFTPITEYSDPETKAFRLPEPNSSICLMLHGPNRFKIFIRPGTESNDATKTTEALFSLCVDKKELVDEVLAKAVEAGGTADPYKLEDYGESCGMYTRSFADLDGHIWEVVAMAGTAGPGCGKEGE